MAATERPAPATERPAFEPRPEPDRASMSTLLSQLKDLVLVYARQQTVDPLKDLGRYVLWGVVGAVLIALGAALLALAALRAIQFETRGHLTGDWSWLPYVGGVLLALAIAGAAASRISKAPR